MAIEAYTNATFTGANIPHIDPLKEVLAERAKLGNDKVPLTTAEAATEAVGTGSFSANMNQYKRELKQVEEMLGEQELSNSTVEAITKAAFEIIEEERKELEDA